MRKSLLAFGAIAISCQSTAAPKEALHLAPSSPWEVNYAADSCRLARAFGEGDRQIGLVLTQFEPGDDFQMVLLGNSLQPRSTMQPYKMSLRFGPSEPAHDTMFKTGVTGRVRTIILTDAQRLTPFSEAEKDAFREREKREIWFEKPKVDPVRAAAVRSIEIRNAFKNDVVLDTGSFQNAMSKLQECTWSLVRDWGLDVEQQKALSRKVRPAESTSKWFSPNDYPEKMISGSYEGIVNYRMIIDAKGKPMSCTVQASTRPKEFDDAVCNAVMKRASFEPALDAQSRPVRSYWHQTVHFRLEA